MKMENEIAAPASGTVEAVRVSPGDAVAAGQVLVSVARRLTDGAVLSVGAARRGRRAGALSHEPCDLQLADRGLEVAYIRS